MRETVLHRVRAALGRSAEQAVAPAPPVWLDARRYKTEEDKIAAFCRALETAGGVFHLAAGEAAARETVAGLLNGRTAVASRAGVVEAVGVSGLPGVQSRFGSAGDLRAASARADVGITAADYAIAATGTLVLMASAEEARMISLLPPAHIAVVPRSRLVSNLSEFFERVPLPGAGTSALVFLTGPSRTADIEQILVRGVHGPRYLDVVLY